MTPWNADSVMSSTAGCTKPEMRVLANTFALNSLGGTERILFEVSRELVHRGHELDLLYVQDGDLADDYRSFCRSVTQVPTFDFARSHAARDLMRLMPAVRVGRRCRPNVVYVSRFHELAYAVMTGGACRAPVVCHLHYVTQHRPTRLMGRRVRRFIAVSEATKREWIRAGLEPEWIEVVPNGIDPTQFSFGGAEERRQAREALELPLDAFVALYCGRMSPAVRAVRRAGFSLACSTFADPLVPGTSRYRLPRRHVRDWNGEEFEARLQRWLDE